MASKDKVFVLNKNKTNGSKLSSLTDPTAEGKIKYLTASSETAKQSPAGLVRGITGVIFPIGRGALDLGQSTSDGFNQIGDPGEKNYSLTSGDLQVTGPEDGNDRNPERDGGAQKFVNALLDSAYVAYNSGVSQGSGLSSMTVNRGALTLTSSNVTGISGVVNHYSRSYSVTFAYTQSGMITAGTVAALPDISNDLDGEKGDGPF